MSEQWKITIPVMLSEDRADGRWLIGEASGTEGDTKGTEMAPECIADFRDQIVSRAQAGDPIPYKDSHDKTGTVLADLGWVMDGEVTRDEHLRVAVKLDDSNPASVFLHEQVKRGKQYGMSVSGDGVKARVERNASGRVMRMQFVKVILHEISNTTRPSWVPSFGTVLARSIDGEVGELMVAELAPASEETTEEIVVREETPPVEEGNPETPPETPVVEAAPEGEAPVERGVLNKGERDALLSTYLDFGAKLHALGIDVPQPVAPAQPEGLATPEATPESAAVPVQNSDTGELIDFAGVKIERAAYEAIQAEITVAVERAVEELNTKLTEKDTYISELEAMPAGHFPVARDRAKFQNPQIPANLDDLPADEKLKVGLRGLYGDN